MSAAGPGRTARAAAMSIPELGRRLGISRRSAYYLVQRRLIATVALEGRGDTPRIRVTEQALEAYLQRRQSAAKAA